MEERLPTHLFVQSHLWRLSAAGVPAYVLRKGERESGLVLLKVTVPFQGCRMFSQGRDINGRLGWVPGAAGAMIDEGEARDFVDRHVRRDPDLWVIEVETRDGSNPFEVNGD